MTNLKRLAQLTEAVLKVPRHMQEELLAYLDDRRPPCRFLSHVLANDLYGAACCADESNAASLFQWANVLHWLPGNAWGSQQAISNYLSTTAPRDD